MPHPATKKQKAQDTLFTITELFLARNRTILLLLFPSKYKTFVRVRGTIASRIIIEFIAPSATCPFLLMPLTCLSCSVPPVYLSHTMFPILLATDSHIRLILLFHMVESISVLLMAPLHTSQVWHPYIVSTWKVLRPAKHLNGSLAGLTSISMLALQVWLLLSRDRFIPWLTPLESKKRIPCLPSLRNLMTLILAHITAHGPLMSVPFVDLPTQIESLGLPPV